VMVVVSKSPAQPLARRKLDQKGDLSNMTNY